MRSSYIVPFAILVAGALVAVAVYSYFHVPAKPPSLENLSVIRPVDDSDHIFGNPAASVKFIEYCDIDSPFCKTFRDTMEKVMATYGAGGNVAWIYRHLPIADQHPNAETHAEAAECVAAEGGTSAFFKFIDLLNAAAPVAAQFDPTQYGPVVQELGLDTDAFTTCLSGHTYAKRVAADSANVLAAGGTGAPYTVFLIKGQAPISLSGAFSYDEMKQLVDAALLKLGAK